MISHNTIKDYCIEDPSLIENYNEAINSKEKYDCHHRLETELNVSAQYLKDNNLYLNRPASELIFLPHREHVSLHNKHGLIGFKGKTASKETRLKQRLAKLGTKLSEEHKKKIGDSLRGRKNGPLSEEHKKKISLAHIGKQTWNKGKKRLVKHINNGTESKMVEIGQLEYYLNNGWKLGRIYKRRK